jgi:hypothetical protein
MKFGITLAVAAAPPPQFSRGGKWEAMHGDMTGYCEIRRTDTTYPPDAGYLPNRASRTRRLLRPSDGDVDEIRHER